MDLRVQRLRAMFARLREAHGLPVWQPRAGKGEPSARVAYAKNLRIHKKALNKARKIRLGRAPILRTTIQAGARTRTAVKRSFGFYDGLGKGGAG